MAQIAILVLGIFVLSCGSVGLLAVRLTNPLLRGVGWLGGAFVSGCVGAALLLLHGQISPAFSVAAADMSVLLGFVLLHVAVLELAEGGSLIPSLGVILLLLQAAADLYVVRGGGSGSFQVAVVGLLVAAQVGETAFVLMRLGRRTIRVPAWFSAAILAVFMLFNLVRSLAVACGLLRDRHLDYQVQVVAFAMFIAVALGIGFGFFWMTTAMLSSGLESLASTDPLTRIYNRRVFLLWCEKESGRSQKTGLPFSVLMIDLDHFKRINDEFGHDTGDRALCAVVEKIQDSVRGIDVIGRWGGEEFVALLPGAAEGSAFWVAQRVRANIEKMVLQATHVWRQGEVQIRLTASVGVATYKGPEDCIHDMLKRADTALYEAKTTGRNRVLALG
jgi:diguanylate cyclase (GGDEF)-like protein